MNHIKKTKKNQHNFNSIYSSLQMCSTLTTSTGRNCCLSQKKKQEYKNILNSVRLTWHIYYNFFSPSVTYVSG